MAFTGISGSLVVVPLTSVHVVPAPAVPLTVLKTWPLPSHPVLQVAKPENAT